MIRVLGLVCASMALLATTCAALEAINEALSVFSFQKVKKLHRSFARLHRSSTAVS